MQKYHSLEDMANRITAQQRDSERFGPTTRSKLWGIAVVSEEWHNNLWVRGRLMQDEDVVFELSYDNYLTQKALPQTCITYLGAWSDRRTLIEYASGALCVVPDATTYGRLFAPMIVALSGYFPTGIDRAALRRERERQLGQK